jgi:hypothetical protein
MTYSIKDIAAAFGTKATGDIELRVAMVREPASTGRNDLALAIDPMRFLVTGLNPYPLSQRFQTRQNSDPQRIRVYKHFYAVV